MNFNQTELTPLLNSTADIPEYVPPSPAKINFLIIMMFGMLPLRYQ
jgi:hypothetical protein